MGGALAENAPCTICSVEQKRLHDEECALMETYEGERYYFCNSGCRETFLKDPKSWSGELLTLRQATVKSSQGKAGIGDQLPEFRFPLQPLGSVSNADLKGKVLLLNMWATWCAPCKAEMPHLVQLQREHAADGLVVLGLSFDKTEEAHREGVKELNLNFPSVLAKDTEVQEFLKQLEPVEAIPVTIIVDRQGRIVERLDGAADLEKFRQLLAPYLKAEQTSHRVEEPREGSLVPS